MPYPAHSAAGQGLLRVAATAIRSTSAVLGIKCAVERLGCVDGPGIGGIGIDSSPRHFDPADPDRIWRIG